MIDTTRDGFKLPFYGDTLRGMMLGFHGYDGQQKWVKYEDAQSAIQAARADELAFLEGLFAEEWRIRTNIRNRIHELKGEK